MHFSAGELKSFSKLMVDLILLEWDLREPHYTLNTWVMSALFPRWRSTDSVSSTYCICQYDCLSLFGWLIQYLMWWYLRLFRKLHSIICFVIFLITFGLTSWVNLAINDANNVYLRRFLIIALVSWDKQRFKHGEFGKCLDFTSFWVILLQF